MPTVQKSLHRLLSTQKLNPTSRRVNLALTFLIVLSLICVVAESYDTLAQNWDFVFRYLDFIFMLVFSVEYLARLWIAPLVWPHLSTSKAVWRHMCSKEGLIDFLALLPFYLPYFLSFSLSFLRVFRLLRLFRLFRLKRYTKALTLFTHVIWREKEGLILSFLLAGCLLFVGSVIVYTFEGPAQPTVFSDIPTTMWWAVVTITTIGYGDMTPITLGGRLATSLISLLGILIIALPTALITSGIMENLKESKDNDKKF